MRSELRKVKREAELQLVKTQSCALLVKCLYQLIAFTCITSVMLFTCNFVAEEILMTVSGHCAVVLWMYTFEDRRTCVKRGFTR